MFNRENGYAGYAIILCLLLLVGGLVARSLITKPKQIPIMETMYYHKDGTTGFCYSVIEDDFRASHARVPCDLVEDLLENE